MKSKAIFAVGSGYLVAVFLFMVYPQWLAFFVSLMGISFIGWGIVIFPKYSAQFEMRLPDIHHLPPEQQSAAQKTRIQGLPVPFGETRIVPFEVRTVFGPVISMAVTFVILTYIGGRTSGLAGVEDARMFGGLVLMYFCLFLGGPLVALSWRWYNERKVLHSAGVQFIMPGGTRKGVIYDFRDGKREYFGSSSLRFDKSWSPGELDLVLYSPDNPERSYTASSFFFHRIRRLDCN
jgi:hypothetical protein